MKMRNVKFWLVLALMVVHLTGLGGSTLVAGVPQEGAPPPVPNPPVAPEPPNATSPPQAQAEEEAPPGPEVFRNPVGPRRIRPSSIVRVGSDYSLPPGETVGDIAIVSGSATIAGTVDGDVAVVLGDAILTGTAVIDGDLAVVGGSATLLPGAVVTGDVVAAGGTFDAPAEFVPGGEQVVIGPVGGGDSVRAVVPWITRGLFWGRPIVPDLPWVWAAVGIAFLIYIGLGLVFGGSVRACSDVLIARPVSTLLAGLLVMLLAAPVLFILIASFVGIAVVPFLVGGLVIAALIGKAGVFRWMGAGAVREDATDNNLQLVRSVTIGFVLVTLVYMVPVLGFLAWTLIGVLGLGAATVAVAGALRTENPPSPIVAGPPPPSSAPPATSSADAAAGPDDSDPLGTTDMSLFPRATFLARLGAFALDFILVLMTFWILGLENPGRFLLLFLAYHVGFWSWKGVTVGGIICQFRIVKTDGSRLGFGDALVRALAGIFSIAALGLGCLWILWDAERQSWHDRIARTYVVSVPRNWPLS